MHKSQLDKSRQDALDQLEAAEAALTALGFCLYRQAAFYEPDRGSVHFATRVSVPYAPGHPLYDHSFADAIRDLSVAWHNASHPTSRLGWRSVKSDSDKT